MFARTGIGRCLRGVTLLTLAGAWLFSPEFLVAQNTATQTLDATIVPLGGLFMPSSQMVLKKPTSNFNVFTGSVAVAYRVRTTQGSGQGMITVQATTDFAPVGGPSIANPPSAGDSFTYTCTGATLGVACSGTQTVSTTSATNVISLGASECTSGGAPCSSVAINTATITFLLPDDPKYQTGSYSATLTWTISAS